MKNTFQLTNYHAVTHPSQPNYVAQLAGTYSGCSTDSDCNLRESNLVDLLDQKNSSLTWRSYQENYVPLANGNCNMESSGNKYYRKHNPFMSFTDITGNLSRCQSIVPETTFQSDVKANKLPNFGYYTPNIDDDSHDQDLDYSGKYFSNWLDSWYTPYLKSWENVLFFVTFDEDEGAEGNHVVAFYIGSNLTAGGTDGGSYTHYSVTRFVEDNWGLASLNQNDKSATSIADKVY